MEWFGFWIFLLGCVGIDAWLYSQGNDGWFFIAKTPTEKALQHYKVYGVRLLPPKDPLFRPGSEP